MMRARVSSCCQALRLGRQAEASDFLIPILEFVSEQLGNLPSSIANQVQACFSRALQYQETQNHIALADELEYVLLPLLEPVLINDACNK